MKRRTVGLALLLIAATYLAYWPAYFGQFIWDDDRYVWQNTLLRSVAGLGRIWTDIGATPQYYPLTHTVFWLEWHAWQDRVLGYHLVNVSLHILAALLIVRLLVVLRVPGAWLAGFVFALHPLHVESVAWISELKNTLSIVFWLLATLSYARYAALDPDTQSAPRHWVMAFVFFLAAVLSKTVSSTMPAVMLVLIAWKRRRIRWRDVAALLPFFAVSIVASAITGQMERAVVGAEGHDWDFSFAQRVLIAGRAIWWYATQLIWPTRLAFSYTRWTIDATDPRQWAFVAAAGAMLLLLIATRKRIGNGPITAVLIFCGTLFPALGFFNLFPHRFSFVADHFQYVSDVALIALFCAGVTRLGRRVPAAGRWVWCVSLLALLATATFAQSKIYQNQETLWRDTIAKTPTSWLAHNNLGVFLMNTHDAARLPEAIAHLQTVERLRPEHDRVHWTLGDAYLRQGNVPAAQREFDWAIAQYNRQIAENPTGVNPYQLLASLYDRLGRSGEATQVYERASDRLPDQPYFAQQAAQRLLAAGRPQRAVPYLNRWAALRPDAIEPRIRLAHLYGSMGRGIEARAQLQQAARIDPRNPEVVHGFELINAWMSRPAATQPSP